MPRSPKEACADATGRLSRVAVSVALMLTAAGCGSTTVGGKPKAVSLEEAKQITAQFEDASFTPPPRNINDIKAVLSQEKPDDLEAFNQALAIANSEPPVKRNAKTLGEFYFKRALAAHEIGRAKQEIEDYRMAVKYGEKAKFTCYSYALRWLSAAEVRGGNWSRGIQVGEKVLSVYKDSSSLAAWNSVLSWMYAEVGDLGSSREALDRAEIYKRRTFSRSGLAQKWRDILNSTLASGRAAYLDATGKLIEAEAEHRKSVRLWERYKAGKGWGCVDSKSLPKLYNWKVSELAENLCRQGRLVEAEVYARKAVRGALKSHGRYSAHTAMMVSRLNRIIFEQGRFEEAELLAKANLDIYVRTHTAADSALRADARCVLADALLAQKRWPDALAEYDQIRNSLKTDRAAYAGFVTTKVNFWLALIKGGRSAEALEPVRTALDRNAGLLGDGHYLTAETRGVLAMALAGGGEDQAALAEFARAVPILLDQSGSTESAAGTRTAREFRLELILQDYIRLLASIRGTDLERQAGLDAAAEAFRLADVVRARAVKRALAASSARAAARDPELADLARREQDALTQIRALNGLLSNVLSAPADQQNPGTIKDLQLRIERLRSARAALMKEIEARFPDYADLVNPEPVRIEAARSYLKPGEALVATFVGEGDSYVWAVPHQGPVAFAAAELGEKRIAEMVQALRTSLDPYAGSTLGELPDFDLQTGYRLYAALLKPVAAGWKGADNLFVVAHGALGYLPFAVLPVRAVKLDPETAPLFSNYRPVPWLARTHAVTALPSVASLRTLRNLSAGDPGRRPFTGFGDPCFCREQLARKAAATDTARAANIRGRPLQRRGLRIKMDLEHEPASADMSLLPPLPDTADELRGIARALKADVSRDLYLGKAASEDRVKSMDLTGVKVLAFATHGLLPGELDGLSQPALALSSPAVTGGTEDGLLTMGEILGLRLNADWVVLSACNTGTGEGAGAEAVSGLGRAFFYAGTRSLLVSNWAVETTSAKTLTTGLFRRQSADPDLSRAEALKATMLDMIEQLGFEDSEGRMVFSYAHPIFWGPFSLVGDGGL
jgi:tetratricopeptide (TPR) repeat protein